MIGHHVPVHRSTVLVAELVGMQVCTGFAAGLRWRAAALIRDGGFCDAVKRLLATAPVVHADETFARYLQRGDEVEHDKVEAWLFTVARNLVRSHQRSTSRWLTLLPQLGRSAQRARMMSIRRGRCASGS